MVSIALIGIGAFVLANQGKYSAVFGENTNTLAVASGLVIGVGCLIFLTAFCGCCGAVKESSCLLKLYIIILILLVVLEIAGGILALVFRGSINDFLSTELQKQVTKSYGVKNQTGVTDLMDLFQQEQKCCGVGNYTDYKGSEFQKNDTTVFVPQSCCKDKKKTDCNKINAAGDDVVDVTQIYTEGCLTKMVQFFEDNFLYIGAAALALVAFEILAAIFACCVIGGIKRGDYE